jgi:hypothetical protein
MTLSLLVLFLWSCNDFLDYNENSFYGESDIFQNYTRSESFVTNIYGFLPAGLRDVGDALRSSACDESEYVWDDAAIHNFYNGSWSSINTVDDCWGYYYAAIRAANLFLRDGTGQTFPEHQYNSDYHKMMQKYNNFQWEVRFLRAYFHFELLKRYKNISLVTTVLDEKEANEVVQATFDTVVKFIIDECNLSAVHLPKNYVKEVVGTSPDGNDIYENEYFDDESGRVTKLCPMALKSRVLLYAASKLHNPQNDKQKWKDAALAAKALIDSAANFGVASFPNFNLVNSSESFLSNEMILSRRCGTNNYYESINYPIGVEGGNTGNCPTQNLVDCYGMRINYTYDPQDPYKNRDPRLDATVLYHGRYAGAGLTVDISEGGANGLPLNGATKTGYYLSKFINTSVRLTAVSPVMTRHSFPLFRYAEIYLNYAEAMTEAYGWNTTGSEPELNLTAFNALQKIRLRTGLNIERYSVSTFSSDRQFMDALRKERMAELAFEDHRFWDIRRWMTGQETTTIKRMRMTKDDKGILKYETYETNERKWEDKMYLYPIPLSELYKNNKLVQNPGW